MSEDSARSEGFKLGEYSVADGVGNGILSRESSSRSCLKRVAVKVGEGVDGTDLGEEPREVPISAES